MNRDIYYLNKHYHHNTILLFLTLIFGSIFGNQLHVRYDDPIYDYLDRMETQGILPVYMNENLASYKGLYC